jgi:glycosyltransferase involved in cell wall biosynthesis
MVAVAHSGDVHVLDRLRLAGPIAHLLRRRGATISFVSRALRDRFAGAIRSRALAAWVRAMPVCPMGVDTARFRAAAQTASRAGDRIVFLGRLVPIKGIDVLVDAAERLTSDATIAIAGDGPDRDRIRARAAGRDRIELVGEVRDAARDRLLASADIVVVPSVARPDGRTEGAPRVALEAMAAGAAVVASTSGGLAELPRDAVTRVAPGDPAALAEAVDRLLAEPARRAHQVDAGHRTARAHDWTVVGPRLVEPLRIFH